MNIIIAVKNDLHADSIVYFLKNNFVRLSPDELFKEILISSSKKEEFLNKKLNIDNNINSVLIRYAFEELNRSDCEETVTQKFSNEEYGTAIMSLLLEVSQSQWYNFPYSEIQADLKPYSLKVALKQKIKVPEFIITNNKDKIKKFASKNNLVIKAISNADLAIQDNQITKIPDSKKFKSGYTNHFDINKAQLDKWDNTPILLQKLVEKVEEIRVFVIEDKIFSVSTEADNNFVDIRKSENMYKLFYLKDDFKSKLLNLMRELNLKICTFDILLDKDKTLWLTDINPQGNWLGWNHDVDMAISKQIAISIQESY